MSAGQNGPDPMAYRPTSLDFINRPNPVEPHAVTEKHPLDHAPRLEKTAQQDLLRLLIESNVSSNVERPAKRRRSAEAKLLDLPKLPAVKNGTKRLRIPPTLSGLHQPPPDAGLLPSMSVDQPMKPPKKAVVSEPDGVPKPKPVSEDRAKQKGASDNSSAKSRSRRNKWSDEETTFLLKGVSRFGIGNWTQILNCPDYHFERRTAIDLKDRFRVCCPDDYKTTKEPKAKRTPNSQVIIRPRPLKEASQPTNASKTDRKSSSELIRLGINEPFEKSKRRRRTGYSESEDKALLRGFQKHGNAWAAIREDEELGLEKRTATDLRDRFRTKYPEKYEKAGLAPRPEVFPKRPDRGTKEDGTTDDKDKNSTAANEITDNPESTNKTSEMNGPDNSKEQKLALLPKKQPATSLLHYDDVFWGAPFDTDETEAERITLDRRILDWPSDFAKPLASADVVGRGSIDPLATLNLPRRALLAPNSNTSGTQNIGPAASLPSLATITAGSEDLSDQLELPSLMGAFGALDGDGRPGTHIPSLDELWK